MPSFGPVVLRVAAGTVFAAHGAQKIFGFSGGGGLTATAAFFSQLGISPAYPAALLVGFTELIGGLLLVAGAFTIYVSGVLLIDRLVALWKVNLAAGFFLNWTMAPGRGHGYEYSLILIAALASLILTGPGALSVDRYRSRIAATEAASRARLRAGQV
jgi:putative oxidoreductase